MYRILINVFYWIHTFLPDSSPSSFPKSFPSPPIDALMASGEHHKLPAGPVGAWLPNVFQHVLLMISQSVKAARTFVFLTGMTDEDSELK